MTRKIEEIFNGTTVVAKGVGDRELAQQCVTSQKRLNERRGHQNWVWVITEQITLAYLHVRCPPMERASYVRMSNRN